MPVAESASFLAPSPIDLRSETGAPHIDGQSEPEPLTPTAVMVIEQPWADTPQRLARITKPAAEAMS
jgi:hypothetical protein